MEKYFPESETLSIKRLKVAIEKKNWDLLGKGINKAEEMRRAGEKFNQLDLWQNLLLWAESEDVPPSMWEKLNSFIENLSNDYAPAVRDSGIIEEYREETADLIDKEAVVVYNHTFDKATLDLIRKYRINLNNIIYNPNQHKFEPKMMEELASLASTFDEPQEDLKGFISLITLYKGNGSIITNSYSSNLHKMLVKADISVIYPGTRAENRKNAKSREFFPLGGTINSFLCSGCSHRSIKTEFHSKTLMECCSKCKSPMYPDITSTGDNSMQIAPQVWYGAYERLVNAKTWVIITPPSHNDQIALRNLLLDAAGNSCVEEINMITHKFEVFELWKSKFMNLAKNAQVKENHPSIVSFIQAHNEASIVNQQPTLS